MKLAITLIHLILIIAITGSAQQVDIAKIDSMLRVSVKTAKSTPKQSRILLNHIYELLGKEPDSIKLSAVYNNFGLTYYYEGNMDSSIFYYQKSLDIVSQQRDSGRIAQRTKNIGLCYRIMGNYSRALDYYHEANIIYNLIDKPNEIASINNAIGTIYYSLHDYTKSREYYRNALKIWKETADSSRISKALNNIGITFSGEEEYKQAIDLYNQSLAYNQTNDNALKNLGEDYLEIDSLSLAENYLTKTLHLRSKRDSKDDIASVLILLGELNRKKENYEKAKAYFSEVYELLKATSDVNRLYDYQVVKKALALDLGQYRQALAIDDIIDSLNRRLFEGEQLKVLQLQTDFDIQAKESERVLSEERAKIAELQASELKRSTQTRLLIIVLLTLFAFAVLIFSWKLYQKNQKMRLLYEGIDRQNKTIRTLATEAHHKTKNSLQLLASLLRFQSIKASDENTKTALEDAWGRLEAINHVHQKLLSQNLQSDGLALTNNISLKEYLKAVLDGSFAVVDYNPIYPVYELHGDDVELSMEIGWNVGLIVNELATNFIKHVLAEGKKLKVIISNKENHLQIAVSDNGKGYDVNLSKASSFGMEMINIIVHDLKGTLDIKSDENGSRFMIKIPAKLEPHEA